MRILHTAAGLWETTGGPATSVPALCGALADRGHRVSLLTGTGPLAATVKAVSARVHVETAPLGPYWAANYSRSFNRHCREAVPESDVVHTHGVWLHPNWVSGRWARRWGKLLALSPRGMLEPWALGRSSWRKRVIWAARGRGLVREAGLLHATSRDEAENLRRLGISAPVAVVPNGIDLQLFSRGRVEKARSRADTEEPRVVFLGRIHPKKGLDLLLEAWERCGAARGDARLIVAGFGEERHLRWLDERLAARSDGTVEFLGPVTGERKLELLAGSAALVLPSHSENYGLVVAEALACAIPVITTTETPWQRIREARCGWWVQPDTGALTRALEELLAMSREERIRMGESGRLLIERQHSVSRSAEMMEAAYRWALGKGEHPSWVYSRESR